MKLGGMATRFKWRPTTRLYSSPGVDFRQLSEAERLALSSSLLEKTFHVYFHNRLLKTIEDK
ncbi:disease resistance protein [Pyrus ussuriensis x Pyrus communis]|uniref:Disease resistance protein n=1 Tax=Pyrus ussuriensis x Pyrus communis TaxID=2448454 RepID=A0A5N5HMB9_9ROSA|nr:disease resistance protein [Pyrus ussuriensis x Pyrus communis]